MAETMTLKNKLPVAREVAGFGQVQAAGAPKKGDEITVPVKVGNQLRRAEGWEEVKAAKPATTEKAEADEGKSAPVNAKPTKGGEK